MFPTTVRMLGSLRPVARNYHERESMEEQVNVITFGEKNTIHK
jgi:hypothetical protein